MQHAENIASECLLSTEELLLQIGENFVKFNVANFVLDENGLPRSGDNCFDDLNISESGIYAFENTDGIISYIGQGGTGNKTPLRKRISQELRLYDKTSNNAGTLSKNIQTKENITFSNQSEWKKYISKWNIRIIHRDNWNVSLNVIEAFIIEVVKPKYNINK